MEDETFQRFKTTVTITVTASFDLKTMYTIKEGVPTLSDGIVRDVNQALSEIWNPEAVSLVEIDSISAGSTVVKEGRKKNGIQ